MPDYEFHPLYDPTFVGREQELQWLYERLFDRNHWPVPVFVTGAGGVGKTALLHQFFTSRRISAIPLWLDLYKFAGSDAALDEFINYLHEQRSSGRLVVVLDGAEALTDAEIQRTVVRVFNYKAVRSLIFATRRTPSLDRVETLEMSALSASDVSTLMQALSSTALSPQTIEEAIRSTNGFPLAVRLLAGLLANKGPDALSQILSGRLYDLSKTIAVMP